MTPFRVFEIALYALVSFLPPVLLALFPFTNRLRFSKSVTICGMLLLYLVRIAITYLTSIADRRGPIVLLGTFLYALFFFLFIREEFGKCLFPLLMMSNILNLILTATKVTEKLLFPSHYATPYTWTSSLLYFCMELIILTPLYFYFKKIFVPITFAEHKAWKYLWLIPLTFYSVWFRNFYFSAEGSVELSTRPRYLFFSLIVNAGALLVYTVVAQLIRQHAEHERLQKHAHQLSMQQTIYTNLQDRIEEARRSRHDMKQHVHVVSSLLQEKKYEDLEKYLGRYEKSMALDEPLVYCENMTLNALLQYFAAYSKVIGVGFSASVQARNDVGIPDEALTVVAGNLLENAIEYFMTNPEEKGVISVHGKEDKGSMFLKVVNTCSTPPKTDKHGDYLSSKRSGHAIGIGLQSVQNIVERYHGKMRAYWEDGNFIISLLLNIPVDEVLL